ncbi:MAG: two-component regulator propeller domain-containing protein [Bacteroidia bacterium]
MQKKTVVVFASLFFLVNQFLFAQNFSEKNFSFRHLTVENGLSQSSVSSILQDSKGYIWLGTQDGLNRFDGYSFKQYKHNPLDSTSIAPGEIRSLFETQNGLLMIGIDGGGMGILDFSTNKIKTYIQNVKNKKSISNNRVTGICSYNDSLYWISTFGGGLELFNAKSESFQNFLIDKIDSGSYANFIWKMVKDENGIVYLGTRKGLFIFNPVTQEFKAFQNQPNCTNCLSSNKVQSLYDDGNILWVGTYNGILQSFDKQTQQIIQYKNEEYPDAPINSIIKVADDKFWLGTDGKGVSVFNVKEKVFQNILKDPFNNNSINNNMVVCFYRCCDKMLLIGTNGGGLNLYHESFNQFNNTDQHYIKNTLGYEQNNFCVLKDKNGVIWSGSLDDGLRAYNTKTNEVEYFKNEPGNPNSINSNSVFSLFEGDDKLWIGTINGGLNCFNIKMKKFIHFINDTANLSSLNSNNVWCITQSSDKRLWLGTQRGGVNVFDEATEKFIHFTKDSMHHSSVNSNNIYCIKEDSHGNMLIGTQGGGLNILNAGNGLFEYYLNEKGNKNSISNNDVKCIYEDSNGLTWMGTDGGGLNVFDRNKKIFHCFTESDGLPNNTIYGLLPDEKGNLWMSTNKGICKFSYTSNLDVTKLNDSLYISRNISIKNYDHSDGLTSDELNQGAYFKSDDGVMHFGGVKGIISFKPSEITRNTFAPPTVITKIKNYKEELTFNDSTEIELDYKNYLTVEFASLSYLIPEKNKYAFMFEGHDTSWNDLGTTHTVNFLDLKPGNYILKIRGSNNDGVWGTHPAEVKIKVNPPFYQTWWFRILAAVAVAAAVTITFRTRVNRIRKDEAQKTAFNKSLAEMEMKALRAQMNPHFVFNCLNSIHNYILKNDKLNASDYLTKFSRLIRLILENSRHKTVPLKKDMEALELYIKMEQLRLSEACTVKIEIEDEFEIADALIPPLILQPFVENSFKHGLPMKGKEGVLTINIKSENDTLVCIVEDNGIGRKITTDEQKTDRKSLGMTITKERLNVISQSEQGDASYEILDLKDDQNKPCGTRVVVRMPLIFG